MVHKPNVVTMIPDIYPISKDGIKDLSKKLKTTIVLSTTQDVDYKYIYKCSCGIVFDNAKQLDKHIKWYFKRKNNA